MAEIKRIKQCQIIHVNFLKQLAEFVEKSLATAKIAQIQLRLDDLIVKNTAFLKNQEKLESLDEDEMESNIRTEVDNFYYELRPMLEERLNDMRAEKKIKSTIHPIDELSFVPKLPDLVLDHYYGDPTKWRSFIESYNTHVHNNPRLNNFVKFQYLKNCVKSPADKPFENLEFIGDNYVEAYRFLLERNEKPKLIGESHIRALFKIKPLEKSSSKNLLELLDDFNSHLRSLKTMRRPTDYWDDLVVYQLASKFDKETKLKWREFSPAESLPSFADITKFIKLRSSKLEEQIFDSHPTTQSQSLSNPKPKITSNNQTFRRNSFHASSTNRFFCVHCKLAGHSIMRCSKFQSMSVDDRIHFANEHPLCTNCLSPSHGIGQCSNREVCRVCQAKHHTLLHSVTTVTSASSKPKPSTSKSPHVGVAVSSDNQLDLSLAISSSEPSLKYVLLATALVKIVYHNKPIIVRALLDSGSQTNFITRSLASKLGLKLSKSSRPICGIGGMSLSIDGCAAIKIQSLVHDYKAELDVQVVPKITNNCPSVPINISGWAIPSNIHLADPNFFSSNKIDMLIGADLFYELQSIGQINLGSNHPYLQNTRLGWIVSGRVVSVDHSQVCNFVEFHEAESHNLDSLLEKFWSVEEDFANKCSDDSEIEVNPCERHFVDNFMRNEQGRFIIRLPFADSDLNLGDSASMARRRFISLEQRLCRYPELREMYNQFMAEYIELNHMELVTSIAPNHYYLPHHCVLKPDSSTTKLRVVFDGSAKTSSGKSLNQLLMSGPVVQNELFSILLRFRSHAYVVSADITKMYRQILVHPDDCHFQYIFWRFNQSATLQTYCLKTVTYGTTPASFLSTRCLQQLALDNKSEFPHASSIIQNDIYVDDLLTGSNSRMEVSEMKKQVCNILQSAGMQLRKWCANDSTLISDIALSDREQFLQIDDKQFVKTLGIYWQSDHDMFRINVNMDNNSSKVTKRIVVSEIAKIFDPIGLISPIVIVGKMFMQELWKIKAEWDESLPMNLHSNWLQFKSEIQSLTQLFIPRHIFDHVERPETIQIHGFADASEKAYGAAVYVRCYSPHSNYIVRLYCSKSKVVPLKKITLPRLELCAAQLLTNLIAKILPVLNFAVDAIYYWTDSIIVLHWIHSSSSRWQTFVANRVANIQSLSEPANWRHVVSKSNPADLISRGLRPDQLTSSNLWWSGPDYLQQHDSNWNSPFSGSKATAIPEQKKSVATAALVSTDDDILQRIHAHNSFLIIQNSMSYVLRFVHNCKVKTKHPGLLLSGVLSTAEALNGHNLLMRTVQKWAFPDVFNGLQSANFVVRDAKLKSLSLFMGDDLLIRVGGRLQFSSLSYSSKHPILLPHNHYVTLTLFNFIHSNHLHVGPQGLLAAVRQAYWPISGRKLARRVCSNCLKCKRVRPTLHHQQMGNLPTERVNKAMTFQTVGVDYCGPFYVHYSTRGRVPSKAYLAVFVCFATKAVHLEIASNLSTASFMGTLKRFIATRGLCKKIVSDNGTNFVGANSELHELYELLHSSRTKDAIQLMCQRDKIEWSFAPPGSPHFGGLYEAAVKSAKYHLRRIMTNVCLTYEELCTIIKQVEAVLNSRPLTPIPSADPVEILTPGHFLTGRPLTAIPEDGTSTANFNILRHWELVQNIHKHFWNRWYHEYLQELQHRHYWVNKTTNVPIGSIVMLKDDNLPPLHWKFGRVVEVHPGLDGLVRVVSVKVAGSDKILKRSITKVASLPVDIEPVQGGEDDNAPSNNHPPTA